MLETITINSNITATKGTIMESILPVLQIDDYDVAVDFYVKGLGFGIVMEHRHEPNFPVFMSINKG